MARGIYDNNYNRTRIDTRPQSDPAVAAGMRNLLRDTDGTVLSAITAMGQQVNATGRTLLGSRFRKSRLDAGPQTPRLDAMPKPAPSNLEQRQSLFRDMQKVGAGGITPEMKQKAASLGVKREGWRTAMSKLQAAPAAIAAPNAPAASPTVPPALARPANVPPAGPTAPTGAAKARADMAQHGITGAAERFLAANPVKDAEARIAKRNAAKAAATAELDAVSIPAAAPSGLQQPEFGKRAGTGASRFRTAMR